MMELTINGAVYQFNFGMGFMREINKMLGKPIDGIPGEKENIGMQFKIAGVISGDCEALVDVLLAANKGQNPRVTQMLLDSYIDEVDDIDAFFQMVIDFLKQGNASKKITVNLLEEYEKQMKANA
jgi:hypothetical protein